MSSVTASVVFYDKEGKNIGPGVRFFMPDFLDWLSIDAKVFWFVARENGDPQATHLLLQSQGEQRLVTLKAPLRNVTYKELKDNEDGIEQRTQDWIDGQGISRKPRNQ